MGPEHDEKSGGRRPTATEHLEEDGNMWSTCDLCLFVCLVCSERRMQASQGSASQNPLKTDPASEMDLEFPCWLCVPQ